MTAEYPTIGDVWYAFTRRVRQFGGPDVAPASEKEIQAAESELGWRAPDPWRELWKLTNGLSERGAVAEGRIFPVLSRRTASLFRKTADDCVTRKSNPAYPYRLEPPANPDDWVLVAYFTPARDIYFKRHPSPDEPPDVSFVSWAQGPLMPFADNAILTFNRWVLEVTGICLI